MKKHGFFFFRGICVPFTFCEEERRTAFVCCTTSHRFAVPLLLKEVTEFYSDDENGRLYLYKVRESAFRNNKIFLFTKPPLRINLFQREFLRVEHPSLHVCFSNGLKIQVKDVSVKSVRLSSDLPFVITQGGEVCNLHIDGETIEVKLLPYVDKRLFTVVCLEEKEEERLQKAIFRIQKQILRELVQISDIFWGEVKDENNVDYSRKGYSCAGNSKSIRQTLKEKVLL